MNGKTKTSVKQQSGKVFRQATSQSAHISGRFRFHKWNNIFRSFREVTYVSASNCSYKRQGIAAWWDRFPDWTGIHNILADYNWDSCTDHFWAWRLLNILMITLLKMTIKLYSPKIMLIPQGKSRGVSSGKKPCTPSGGFPTHKAFLGLWWDSPMGKSPRRGPQKCLQGREYMVKLLCRKSST